MVWGQVLWLLLAAVTRWSVCGQSVPSSPCPSVFWYETDSSGNWLGRMSIPPPPPGATFRTILQLDIDAVLRTQNVGALKLLENENDVWKRISTGNRWPVQFQVYFPLSWPLPVVRSITSNGNVICIGNTSHTFVTKVTLEHILYPAGGSAYPQDYQNTNKPPNDINHQHIVLNNKNGPFYRVNPQTEVSARSPFHQDDHIQVIYHEEPQAQDRKWPLQMNTTVSSYAICPGVFQYQQSSSGEWYGKISVPNPYPILAIDIRVEMYVTGDVDMISRGTLQLANNLNEEWNRMKRGQKFFIQYKLQFPVYTSYTYTPPLPTVKNIIVNDAVLCRGETPRYSILVTLTYHHSIFSDRCTSSSLKCPYNIEQSALRNKLATPSYRPSSPTYEMTTEIYRSTQQVYTPPSPTHDPTTQFYKSTPSSQMYESSPTAYEPTSKIYESSPSPYQSTSEIYDSSSPKHETTSQTYKPSIATYEPISHTYKQISSFEPISHTYTSSSTTNKPTSQTHRPSPPVEQAVQTEEPMVLPRFIGVHTEQTTESSKKPQCGTLVIKSNPLIAHGEETLPGQWPWHAALYLYRKRDFKYRCGGSFVGIRTVVTAAHCVTMKGEPYREEDFIVYLGRHNLRNMNEYGLQYKNVYKIAVHPTYNGTYTIGDIAILILSTAVEVTEVVRPVCLWGEVYVSHPDIINQEGLVVGWGLDERDEPTETLMMVKMPVVSQQTCIWSDPTYYPQFTSNKTFCAGFRNGSSVCNGDSGGGMVFPTQLSDGTQAWMLRGIVSHSRPRDGYISVCDTKSYIVFTDVAQYLDWLHDILI